MDAHGTPLTALHRQTLEVICIESDPPAEPIDNEAGETVQRHAA